MDLQGPDFSESRGLIFSDSRDPIIIFLILGIRFSILVTGIGSLNHLKKPALNCSIWFHDYFVYSFSRFSQVVSFFDAVNFLSLIENSSKILYGKEINFIRIHIHN